MEAVTSLGNQDSSKASNKNGIIGSITGKVIDRKYIESKRMDSCDIMKYLLNKK
jgi:hypothetical protein